MRKFLVFSFVMAVLLLLGSTVQAADRIGFVDIRKIMAESEAGKRSTQEIMSMVEKKRSEIESKEAQLQKLKDELEKQRSLLTETAYREKEMDYQRLFRDYQRFVEDANEEMRIREQRITTSLIPDIQKVISDVGTKEGYSAIFDVGTAGLLFSSGKNDITTKVIEAYNRITRAKR
ncbi:MAG: OmpH family outer membrane protein [Syntrophales bacterium]|nr:OmpH family outer membrane protein [Syntrophales bacterium]